MKMYFSNNSDLVFGISIYSIHLIQNKTFVLVYKIVENLTLAVDYYVHLFMIFILGKFGRIQFHGLGMHHVLRDIKC